MSVSSSSTDAAVSGQDERASQDVNEDLRKMFLRLKARQEEYEAKTEATRKETEATLKEYEATLKDFAAELTEFKTRQEAIEATIERQEAIKAKLRATEAKLRTKHEPSNNPWSSINSSCSDTILAGSGSSSSGSDGGGECDGDGDGGGATSGGGGPNVGRRDGGGANRGSDATGDRSDTASCASGSPPLDSAADGGGQDENQAPVACSGFQGHNSNWPTRPQPKVDAALVCAGRVQSTRVQILRQNRRDQRHHHHQPLKVLGGNVASETSEDENSCGSDEFELELCEPTPRWNSDMACSAYTTLGESEDHLFRQEGEYTARYLARYEQYAAMDMLDLFFKGL